MSIQRKKIRQTIQSILKSKDENGNYKTDAEDRIYTNLANAVWREQMPAVVIYCLNETIERTNMAPVEYRRNLAIVIEIFATGPDDPNTADGKLVQDQLDDIAEQVETELNRDTTLGDFGSVLDPISGKRCAIVDDLLLSAVEFEFAPGDGPTGSAKLLFNAVYHEFRPRTLDEQPNIGTLETVNAKWDIQDPSAPPDVDEAEDDLTVPTE